MTFICSIMRTL